MKSYSSTPASMASLGPEQACCVYVLRMRAGPIETPWRGVGAVVPSPHPSSEARSSGAELWHAAPRWFFKPTRGGLSAPHTVHHNGPCRRVRLSGPELCTIGASKSGSRHGTALGAVCRLLPPGLVVKQQGRCRGCAPALRAPGPLLWPCPGPARPDAGEGEVRSAMAGSALCAQARHHTGQL